MILSDFDGDSNLSIFLRTQFGTGVELGGSGSDNNKCVQQTAILNDISESVSLSCVKSNESKLTGMRKYYGEYLTYANIL